MFARFVNRIASNPLSSKNGSRRERLFFSINETNSTNSFSHQSIKLGLWQWDYGTVTLLSVFKMAKKCAQSEQITILPESADLADGQGCRQADVTKLLTPVDIG